MMMKKILWSALFLLPFSLFAQKWEVIPDSASIRFSGKKAEGTFQNLMADIAFDPTDLSNASFNASIDVATIDLGNKTQTKHAKSDNWLDAITHPKITFVSNEVMATETGFVAKGTIGMHGVSQPAELPFTFETSENDGVFKGQILLMRDDYNIGKAGTKTIQKVTIDIVVPVKKG